MAIIEKFFPNPNSGNKGTINLTVTSASYAATVTSASYALTASYAMNGGGGGTTTGSFTGSFTGSLSGTASYALNGGVTQLLAGPNITLSPLNGLGQVTITSTAGGGGTGNTSTSSYGSFYSTQTQTASAINTPTSMSFNQIDISNGVSISGSTSSSIKVTNAGVYNVQFSAQLARAAGSGTEDVLIWLRKNGSNLAWTNTDVTFAGGTNISQVAAWNWFVTAASNDYYELMWSTTSTNIIIKADTTPNPDVPSVILTVNRIDQFLSNTGSFTGSFTGTLTGTATTASYLLGSVTSASYASTASYVNPLNQNVLITGSLNISGSGVITNTLTLGKTYPSLLSGDDLKQIFWWPSSISVASLRNVFIGNNDVGSVSTTGWPNIVIGSFTSVALSSGTRNIIFGNYESLAIATGNRNIGYNTAYTVDVSETIGFNSVVSESNTVTFGNQDRAKYSTWYLGSGQSNANGYGIFDMNWYATSVTQGTSNANSINTIWRLNGGRGTGTGNNGDIRLAVALTGSSGANWNSLVDVLNVKGNTGYVGINTISPTHQLAVNGNSAITGSLIVTQGITGSLFGTASWSNNASTASYISYDNMVDEVQLSTISSFRFLTGN